MSKEDWKSNTIDKIFKDLYPKKVGSILDLACGISCKSQYLKANIKIGVDIYRPYLEKARSDYNGVLVNYDITHIEDLFLPKSFDVILLLDVVEHLAKNVAFNLITKCEKIAKKAVIIETPKGYVPQNIDIWGLGGDYYQTHRSEWYPLDFEQIKYEYRVRDYKMQEVRRHTDINDIETNIQMIDAIKLL